MNEPRRPALRIWPGFGSWHLKHHGTRTSVRYSVPTRSGSFLATVLEVEDAAVRNSAIPMDGMVRGTIARQLREARAKR